MINKLFLRKNFDKIFLIFLPILISALIFLGLFSLYFISNSPVDYQQSNAVKIMYIHVPSAWMALMIYCLVAIFSVSAFIWKNPFFHLIARIIAKIGCSFAFLTLITGSLWGKPIWGAWWVWDARLTSMLILFFLYLGYLLVNFVIDDKNKAEKISAIIAIIGFINVPIVKFSVDYWNSLHQVASIFRKNGVAIHPSMLFPLMFMFAFCFCYFVLLSMISIKTELIKTSNKVS